MPVLSLQVCYKHSVCMCVAKILSLVHNMISHQLATHWILMNWWLLSGVEWFIQQQHRVQCLVTLNIFLVCWSFCPPWLHLQPSPLQYFVFEVLIEDKCLSWLGFACVMPLVFLHSVASADVDGSTLYYHEADSVCTASCFQRCSRSVILHLEGWRF